jgi:hypothetical protein
MKLLCALVCFLFASAHPALAETRSTAYATWNVVDGNVRVLYSIPTRELTNLAAPGLPVLTTKQVADYALSHLSVTREGKMCPVVDQGEEIGKINTLALIPGYLRFEIVFQCRDNTGVTLSDTAFADRTRDHFDFARVQVNNGGFFQHVFTASEPRLNLSHTPAGGQSDSMLRFAMFGLSHVFRSLDSLCLVLALLLIARQRQDYLVALGALFTGYALAAILSPFDLVAPRFSTGHGVLILVAAVIGIALSLPDPRRATVALGSGALVLAAPALALQGFAAAYTVLGVMLAGISSLFNPRPESRRAAFIAMIAFVFAFLDGFVLTRDLAYLSVPGTQLALMVSGFNLGAFLAGITIPLCLVIAWFLVPKARRLFSPGNFASDLAGSVFAAFGTFWFGSWLFG